MMLKTPRWRDMHVHFRQDQLLQRVAGYTGKYCDVAVVMPNTKPAVRTAEEVHTYRCAVKRALRIKNCDCNPIITAKLTPQTTPETIERLSRVECLAIKVYAEGMTTNSHDGISRETLLGMPDDFLQNLQAIQNYNMLLLWHGELPGSFSLDREQDFLPVIEAVLDQFQIPMVLEHITTAAAVEFVRRMRKKGHRLGATITSHHLWMRNGLDDVLGDLLYPDRFCKPIPKRPDDWAALLEVAVSGEAGFFWGSDSAPHQQGNKYSRECCAGCFTAPNPEMLLQIFDEAESLHNLTRFVCGNATEFYGLPEPSGELVFEKKSHTVPEEYEKIVPFLAGQKLDWTLQ